MTRYQIVFSVLLLLTLAMSPSQASDRRVVSESYEWTHSEFPPHPDLKLPNVFLVGDSITAQYFPDVVKNLEGKANCTLFATSKSIGDPRLIEELAGLLKYHPTPFQVIHFNNGMHGWGYTEEEFKTYFHEWYDCLHAAQPKTKFIWATITPVKKNVPDGPQNDRIDVRNTIATAFVTSKKIPIDDQYALIHRHYTEDIYADDIHFNATGKAIQAQQVADVISQWLPKP